MELLHATIAVNTVLAASIILIVGLWIYFERPDRALHQTFAALLMATSLWLFTFVFFSGTDDASQKLFWFKTLFCLGSFLPVLFLLFTLAFIGRFPPTSVQALLLSTTLPLAYTAYGTHFLVRLTDASYVLGVGRGLFAWHFGVMLAAAFVAILYALRTDPALDQRRSGMLTIGAMVAFHAVFLMLFVTRLGEGPAELLWLQALVVIPIAAGMTAMAYVVDAKRFLVGLRPVGAELLTLVVIALLSVDIAVTDTSVGLTVRLVVLIMLIFYGASAVRAAEREMRRLREIGRLHEELVKMNGRLLESDKLKTKMVSFATHQLRAPLGGVRSYMELLREGGDGPVTKAQRGTIDTCLDALGRLNTTIDTFLDLSKLELGAPELFRTSTDIVALVDQVITGLRPTAEKKRLELTKVVSPGLPQMRVDAGKLYHAILNLVHNAINHTDRGGITVTVAVADDRMTVSVADSGEGLTAEERSSLLKMIEAGLSAYRFDVNGSSGLGLIVVKTIVEAHGGDISIESAGKGNGATFGFRIPLD